MKQLRNTLILPLLCAGFTLCACSGEDRSGEQPFKPTVKTLGTTVEGNQCRMTGEIVSSPNSKITGRGFYYGNDTLRIRVLSEDTLTTTFTETVDSIKPGIYYVYAFAANGMGVSYGDTLSFYIPEK